MRFINLRTLLSAAISMIIVASCAAQNHFIGTWSGSVPDKNLKPPILTTTCTFTASYVRCKDSGEFSDGETYAVKSGTEAVSERVGYDFIIQPDGSMIFDNGRFKMTLHRVTTP